ncbi:YafY family transcriptional regulator [Bradyrhizobium sp. CCGB12]|uniref:helix-turn-helix transcriptional regulator n=1 Tax=Bradyrhizobium sp. CCGB12 TaxID=2949632 RepID=UPI0020B3102E|nr:YafY family protein [Bradyrhizobium sp. CCGB12]MCP3392368.1 YafY family transcriptional regulator [Bradyrhizobium sp. CCGB12]
MSKSHRLFDLMQILRSHRQPVAGVELAREAGVSLRTIRRDISTLRSIGADIDGESSVGYVLKPGFLLPPLMFSEEEIHALALGAQWVRGQTDDSLAGAAQNALAKIDAVLPPDLRRHLHDGSFHVSPKPTPPTSVDPAVLRQSMRQQCKVLLTYRDFHGAATERVIWPISLGFIESQRFAAAWCELRQDFRVFRVDRMERVELQADRYPGRRRDLVKRWRAQVASKDVDNRS